MADSLIGTVKEKVDLAKAHAPDVVKTGVDTIRQAAQVLDRAKEEVKQTLKGGADKIRHQIANLTTMTRKEQAEARKEEVKAKKRAKRAGSRARSKGEETSAKLVEAAAPQTPTLQ